ncbi:MAG: fimbrillin family protein [Rikenellaceae bacterium]
MDKLIRKSIWILLSTAMLTISSCDGSGDDGSSGGGGEETDSVEYAVSATIKVVASPAKNFLKSEFASGDSFTLTSQCEETDLFDGVKFTLDDANWSADGVVTFERSTTLSNCIFSAIYPALSSTIYDVSQESEPLLFASKMVDNSTTDVDMQFMHKLSELVFVFTDDAPQSDEIQFEASIIHTLQIEPITGDTTYGDPEITSISMYNSEEYPSRYSALFVPQNISSYKLAIDGVEYTSNTLNSTIIMTEGGSLSYIPVLYKIGEPSDESESIDGFVVDATPWIDDENNYELELN